MLEALGYAVRQGVNINNILSLPHLEYELQSGAIWVNYLFPFTFK